MQDNEMNRRKDEYSLQRRKKKHLFTAQNQDLRRKKKSKETKQSFSSLEHLAIESSLLHSNTGGGELYHEQYDEHGVKIEHQCFT